MSAGAAAVRDDADARSIQLLIGGKWRDGTGEPIPFRNPATGSVIGSVARATAPDIDRAIAAAEAAWPRWSRRPAVERAMLLHAGATALRKQVDAIARLITAEQGKPLAEARAEVLFAAEVTDWFADEGRRLYGRLIPSRTSSVVAQAVVEPAGIVAGLSPWNYPVGQAVRKIAIALAAGCPLILKAPEETPASAAAMVRCFVDAGLPEGVLNLLFGDPAEISRRLILHPEVRVVSFTGSTAVGRQLAALAGGALTRSVMELGGHAPALVFADADWEAAADQLARDKIHNAGQACISPTRLLVAEPLFDRFVQRFVGHADGVHVGDGSDAGTAMGPLANPRRVEAMTALVEDALAQGARLLAGGKRIVGPGNFFPPTVLADVPTHARIMNEEPFGPVAIINRFTHPDEAFREANRLPYALAAYGFTRDSRLLRRLSTEVRAGMVSVNSNWLGVPEVPFGGMRDSGFGDEGALEALREMTVTRLVSIDHGAASGELEAEPVA